MKRMILYAEFLILSSVVFSQEWQWQNPFPAGGYLQNVKFLNPQVGWACGLWGILIKTTDGGISWKQIPVDTLSDYVYNIHFFDENTGFVAVGNSVLKTTNGGENWEVKLHAFAGFIAEIAFLNEQVGYAGGTAVYKTTDGGESWSHSRALFWDFYEMNIIDENTVTAVGFDWAGRSTDGGLNWKIQLSNQSLGPIALLGIHFLNSDTGFIAGGSSSILKTTDGGETWDLKSNIISDGVKTFSGFNSVFFTSSTKGFAVGSFYDYSTAQIKSEGVIIKTTDFGETWTKLPVISNQTFETVYFLDSLHGWIVGDNALIAATTNGGEDWSLLSRFTTIDNLNSIYVLNASRAYAVGDNGAIIVTGTGGETWHQQLSRVHTKLNSVSFSNEDDGVIAGNNGLILFTTDKGNIWEKYQYPDNSRHFTSASFIRNSNTAYVAGSGVLLKSTNQGFTWDLINNNELFNGIWFTSEDNGFAAGDGVKKTTDGGITWSNLGLEGTFMYVAFSDENNGVVCTEADGILYITSNGGNSWEQRTLETPIQIFGLAITESNYITVLAGISGTPNTKPHTGPEFSKPSSSILGKIYRSSDRGVSWSVQHLPGYYMASAGYINKDLGYLAGPSGAIVKTIDPFIPVELISFNASKISNGVLLSWNTATETNNKGFDIERKRRGEEYQTLTFIPGFGTVSERKNYTYTDVDLISGTYVYRLKQIDYDGTYEYSHEIEIIFDQVPSEFVFYQCYPNPFNASTDIKFSIPSELPVSIKIYDLLGSEIITILNETKPGGTYIINFDASLLTSGIYYSRIRAGEYTQTQKMILLK